MGNIKSVIQEDRDVCYLCGKVGKMDEHHVFNGPNRKLSELYGLKVYLCHIGCHLDGRNAVHSNPKVAKMLKEKVQKVAMKKYGWKVSDFIRIFGKNYIGG